MSTTANSKSTLWILLGLALVVRLLLLVRFGAVESPDSSSYREMASHIMSGTLMSDSGFRVPGFPLLMVLTGKVSMATVIVQILLAVASIFFLFDVAKSFVSDRLAAWVVGIYAAWPLFAQYDVELLSESLSTSLTIGCIWAVVRFAKTENARMLILAATLGSLAALTRANIVVICMVLPFWAAFAFGGNRSVKMSRFGLAFVPALVLVGGWSAFNKYRFGSFNISTIGGLAMTDITGDMLAKMPSGQDPALDAYVRASDKFKKENGTRVNAVWLAMDEMSKVSGLSLPAVSQHMMKYNLQGIKQNPKEYVSTIIGSYAAFWVGGGAAQAAPAPAASTPSASTPTSGGSGNQGESKQVLGNFSGLELKAFKVMNLATHVLVFLFISFCPLLLLAGSSLSKYKWLPLAGAAVVLSGFAVVKPHIAFTAISLLFAVLTPLAVYARRKPNALDQFFAFSLSAIWLLAAVSSTADFGETRYQAPVTGLIMVVFAACIAEHHARITSAD